MDPNGLTFPPPTPPLPPRSGRSAVTSGGYYRNRATPTPSSTRGRTQRRTGRIDDRRDNNCLTGQSRVTVSESLVVKNPRHLQSPAANGAVRKVLRKDRPPAPFVYLGMGDRECQG